MAYTFTRAMTLRASWRAAVLCALAPARALRFWGVSALHPMSPIFNPVRLPLSVSGSPIVRLSLPQAPPGLPLSAPAGPPNDEPEGEVDLDNPGELRRAIRAANPASWIDPENVARRWEVDRIPEHEFRRPHPGCLSAPLPGHPTPNA